MSMYHVYLLRWWGSSSHLRSVLIAFSHQRITMCYLIAELQTNIGVHYVEFSGTYKCWIWTAVISMKLQFSIFVNCCLQLLVYL